MDNTVIEIGEHSIDYIRKTNTKVTKVKGYYIMIVTLIIVFISLIFFSLQTLEYPFLNELYKFKRIKNNISNWKNLILDKTESEIYKGSNISSRIEANAFIFNCLDMGDYYVAVKLNETNFLPEFIRRGKGDVWMFKKEAKEDVSSKQFCEYIIRKNDNNNIQCGLDMFNKLGYSGYFEKFHPCQTVLNELLEKFKI